MRYRTLGSTGIEVSTYCLGAMMFGQWGNPDHDEGVRIVHAALDAGINFIDTADVYSAGESEEIVSKALKGRRDDVVLATKVHGNMGEGRNRSGNSRRWIALRGRAEPAAPRHRLDRPVPDPPARSPDRHRGDLVGSDGPDPPGQGAGHRLLDLPGRADRRGALGGRAAGSGALPLRAAPVLAVRPWDRGGGAPGLRALRHGGHLLEPARRGLADGQVPQRRRHRHELGTRRPPPAAVRPGPARQPAQAGARGAARDRRGRCRACRSGTSPSPLSSPTRR